MKIDLRFDESFAKPIDSVWRALTDQRILARWLMDNDFEPRVGRKFTLRDPPTSTWRGWVECEVLELDAPRRMVWSWNSGMDGEITTRLTFELRPDGNGTRLTLCHGGEALPGQGESLNAGWARKIGVLSRVLGPDYARRVAFRASSEQVLKAIATVEAPRLVDDPRHRLGQSGWGAALRVRRTEGTHHHAGGRSDAPVLRAVDLRRCQRPLIGEPILARDATLDGSPEDRRTGALLYGSGWANW